MESKLLAALIATLAAAPAFAQNAGDLLVRVRAVQIDPANEYKDTSGSGVLPVTVSDKLIPEIDFSYFFTRNIAAELILTYPQKHTVKLAGADIGTFKHLPPTLTLQYHFMPDANFRPYLGAGLNYTRISSVKLLGGAADLSKNSYGLALQAGFDYAISKDLLLNVDLKKVDISADLSVGGAKLGEVVVDPYLFGIGIGKRF